MAIYTSTGTHAQDLWHVDGTPDFGVFPAGIIPEVAENLPIWLKVGTSAYGEKHIRMRHGHWVNRCIVQADASHSVIDIAIRQIELTRMGACAVPRAHRGIRG